MDYNHTQTLSYLFLAGTTVLFVIAIVTVLFFYKTYNLISKERLRFKELYNPLVSEYKGLQQSIMIKSQQRRALLKKHLTHLLYISKTVDKDKLIAANIHQEWSSEMVMAITLLESEIKTLTFDLYGEHESTLPLSELVNSYLETYNNQASVKINAFIKTSALIVHSEIQFAVIKIIQIACKANATEIRMNDKDIELKGLDEKAIARLKALAFAYEFNCSISSDKICVKFFLPKKSVVV